MIIFGYKISLILLIILIGIILLLGYLCYGIYILHKEKQNKTIIVEEKNIITNWQKRNLIQVIKKELEKEIETYGESELTDIYNSWIDYIKISKYWNIPKELKSSTFYINDIILNHLIDLISLEEESIPFNKIVLYTHSVDMINKDSETKKDVWIDESFMIEESYDYEDLNMNRLKGLMLELISNYISLIDKKNGKEYIEKNIQSVLPYIKNISYDEFYELANKLYAEEDFLHIEIEYTIIAIKILLDKSYSIINNQLSGNVLTEKEISFFRAIASFADQEKYSNIIKTISK